LAEKTLLRLCRLLGDATRLRIYEIVKARPMGVTVREIAAEVELHPNVARLHLTKLEKEFLVNSRSLPSRSKGRPQRLYLPGSATVELSMPQRNYSLLARLLLEMMEGDGMQERAHEIGVRFGKDLVSSDASLENPAQSVVSALDSLGFEPMLISQRDNQIEIQTGNCIFKELVALNPAIVCGFHHAVTEGIAAQLSKAEPEVSLGSYRCRQVVRFKEPVTTLDRQIV
jgi:predicted ArsR family transcriptional regulator